MGQNGNYDVDSSINPEDLLLGVSSENGKTVQYTIYDISEYVGSGGLGRVAVYDGASDVAAFSQTLIHGTPRELRFGLTGAKTNTNNFPSNYGTLLVNQYSDPFGTSFDFRFLDAGFVAEFDLEFNARFADDSGLPVSATPFNLLVECQLPNGSVQKQVLNLNSTYNSAEATPAVLDNYCRMTFTAFIDDILLDSFLGGKITVSLLDYFDSTNVVTIKDAVLTVRI